MQSVWDPKNSTLKFWARIFLHVVNYHKKKIVHSLTKLYDGISWFKKKKKLKIHEKLQKVIKLQKIKNCLHKISLNRWKLCTMCFCDNWPHV